MTTLRHGHARDGAMTAIYCAWTRMRRRCSDPKARGYQYYGGRGIRVCDRWNSFENFLADMGPHPGKGYSLDRINVNGDYSPENCRWATIADQNRNKRVKETCAAGHQYTPQNTMMARSLGRLRRRCRICFNEYHRIHDAARGRARRGHDQTA